MIRCPSCGSLCLKQESQQQVSGNDTTRKDREENRWEADDLQQMYCHPADPTWYGCIMCNTEFDGDGNEYEIRKRHPFSKSPDGKID